MLEHFQIESALEVLRRGGVIAYPTEAVFGLGCDPLFEDAVQKILQLKNRDVSKGLILVADSFETLRKWVEPISAKRMDTVMATWPGPVTWLFPVASWVPKWVCGKHDTVAIRVSDHPLVKDLCELYQKPLISTSANPEGLAPAITADEVKNYFNETLDYIVQGKTGGLVKPTEIRNALTGEIVRQA